MGNLVVIDNQRRRKYFNMKVLSAQRFAIKLKVISCGACISNHDEAPSINSGYLRQILMLIREPEEFHRGKNAQLQQAIVN